MSTEKSTSLIGGFQRWASQLRAPYLLAVVGGLFLLDLLVPDLLPYFDELILFLLTVLLARWKDRRAPEAEKPPTKTVTPPQ